MKTLLLSLLGTSVLLLTTQCATTPEKEAPAKYESTPSARRAVEREPPAPRNVDSISVDTTGTNL